MKSIRLITHELIPEASETLLRFDRLEPGEWNIRRGSGRWEFDGPILRGFYEPCPGGPLHGQVFYHRPIAGDVALEFEARLPEGSAHDLIWFFRTALDRKPWGAGWLGCLGGWYGDFAGLERVPDFKPSVVFAWKKIETGRVYHIISGAVGNRVFIAVDGEMILHCTDPEPIAPDQYGHIGFGLYQSGVEYRNVRVFRPELRPVSFGYGS